MEEEEMKKQYFGQDGPSGGEQQDIMAAVMEVVQLQAPRMS
jgi:hypothetical protein